MHLMYHLDAKTGKRVYTLKKTSPSGSITKSSHPARFSPDDKYSRQRVTLKKRYILDLSNQLTYRFGLLLTQQPDLAKPW